MPTAGGMLLADGMPETGGVLYEADSIWQAVDGKWYAADGIWQAADGI